MQHIFLKKFAPYYTFFSIIPQRIVHFFYFHVSALVKFSGHEKRVTQGQDLCFDFSTSPIVVSCLYSYCQKMTRDPLSSPLPHVFFVKLIQDCFHFAGDVFVGFVYEALGDSVIGFGY